MSGEAAKTLHEGGTKDRWKGTMTMKSINPLYGALGGDFVGSIYERHNHKDKEFPLLNYNCRLTDDSILTMATADAICSDGNYSLAYHRWGNRHPHRGYGGRFRSWLNTPEKEAMPYGSWGNGAAMRVSPIGFAYQTVDEILDAAEASASATHNHPEGIRGAQATALAVFLARTGTSKDDIKHEIESRFDYNLSQSLDSIRPTYFFDVSCQGTVPVAIRAFLESCSYEDAIRNAISVGGDSDTIAAITGGIALAYYREMPECLIAAIESNMTADMEDVCNRFWTRFALPEDRNHDV